MRQDWRGRGAYELARMGARRVSWLRISPRHQAVIKGRRPIAERVHLKTIVRSGNGRDDEVSRNGRVEAQPLEPSRSKSMR